LPNWPTFTLRRTRKGRDSSRLHYLSEWVERRAMARVRELDADRIAHPNETSTHCEVANIEAG